MSLALAFRQEELLFQSRRLHTVKFPSKLCIPASPPSVFASPCFVSLWEAKSAGRVAVRHSTHNQLLLPMALLCKESTLLQGTNVDVILHALKSNKK